jgi:transposase
MVAISSATMHPEEASSMAQQMSVLGIDIAKLVFHIVGMDDSGHVMLRKRIARHEWLHCIAMLPPALIVPSTMGER